MKRLKYFIKFFFISVIAVGAIDYVKIKTSEPGIIVKKIYKTEYKIKKVPVYPQDYINCYESKIDINFIMAKDNIAVITAHDDCKISTKKIELATAQKGNWKTSLVIGVGLVAAGFCLANMIK